MKREKIISLGMPLDQWKHKSCCANIGIGEDWATVYNISSLERGKGHATELLLEMKKYYEAKGKIFGSSVALNDGMRRILKKINIIEYS